MNKATGLEARQKERIGQSVCIQGWIRTRRDSKGGFSFLEVNDGSCMANIQVIADADLPNYEEEVQKLSAGCSVSISGEVKESGGKQETEIQATEVIVHGWSDPETYPLQKKRHSFEKLREWAHLRPRSNTFGAVARVRNVISRSIHDFYQDEGFLYINTPIITASDCEGAGEMFRVTTLEMENIPQAAGKVDYSQDFFDRPSFLTVSGQLEAEIFATALGKVYTFGPTFRAENSNTSRHLAEFWMVEPEMAFHDLDDNMDLAEKFLKHIFSTVLKECSEDMEFFNERIDETVIETLESIASCEFVRLTYTEAVEILEKSDQQFDYPVEWGADLQSEHERYLTWQHFSGPVILHDYPRTIKPFYMRVNDDEKTVRAMDVLVPKVGKLSVAASERNAWMSSSSEWRSRIWIQKATGGISTCGGLARCRMPVLGWGWNGSCNSSPGWRTSGT